MSDPVITIITDTRTGESKNCVVIYNNCMMDYTLDDFPDHMVIEGNEVSVNKYLESIKDRILTEDWEKAISKYDMKFEENATNVDSVHYPGHYTSGDIECIDAIKSSMSPEEFEGYCKGNFIKYVWRYREKNGLEDLEKANVYLNWLINSLKGENLTK